MEKESGEWKKWVSRGGGCGGGGGGGAIMISNQWMGKKLQNRDEPMWRFLLPCGTLLWLQSSINQQGFSGEKKKRKTINQH